MSGSPHQARRAPRHWRQAASSPRRRTEYGVQVVGYEDWVPSADRCFGGWFSRFDFFLSLVGRIWPDGMLVSYKGQIRVVRGVELVSPIRD